MAIVLYRLALSKAFFPDWGEPQLVPLSFFSRIFGTDELKGVLIGDTAAFPDNKMADFAFDAVTYLTLVAFHGDHMLLYVSEIFLGAQRFNLFALETAPTAFFHQHVDQFLSDALGV
jgi:hypothetical protein